LTISFLEGAYRGHYPKSRLSEVMATHAGQSPVERLQFGGLFGDGIDGVGKGHSSFVPSRFS